ncbi:MAG: tRNA pseudouridine(55) synthase TruB [Deltaproteobacteria bacterium]|nr:tRNA pseudouridine(55) synthase TruB [Deltaproteobacteria bacterium]
MSGVLVLDKPKNITSAKAVAIVKRRLKAKKAGHAGTLDPMATGVLPILLGQGTKLARFFIELEKGYRFTIRLGISTDTGDADGNVLEESDCSNVRIEDVEKAVGSMKGTIDQVPPMFSALKKNGVRLYKLARQGKEVEREARKVTIYRLDISDFSLPFVTLEMECSKGTYAREVAAELGRKLGCGAHTVELRRTYSGPFKETQAVELDDLDAECTDILDLVQATSHLPTINLDKNLAKRVRNGYHPNILEIRDLIAQEIEKNEYCRLLDHNGDLAAVAKAMEDLKPGSPKLVAEPVKLLRVFS